MTRSRISPQDFAREPFRAFFPIAALAGISGVALWPLHFWGLVQWYPGQIHARVMAYGLFGGFIFGFLGTAMPRMLSAQPLRLAEVFGLLAVYLGMVVSFLVGNIFAGDALLVLLLCGFGACLAGRLRNRKDTPPPGFVLVGFAFLSVISGAIISLLQPESGESNLFWLHLQRLLSYQGFILLPILGIGPFILPRFFGLESSHDFPTTLVPVPGWTRKAILAAATGIMIIATFLLEASTWYRTAYGTRFLIILGYLWIEMPFHRGPRLGNALGASIRSSFLSILAGFLAISLFPAYRVALLHITLVGGFAVITFIVATRVVFGHSGNIHKLKSRTGWVWVSVAAMLLGMATRISGDFWPEIMATHYNYGALVWIAGVLLWAAYVLPYVLRADPE
ncbi:MAG TPA: NnrS family protein [Verrucomicrobiae bacterium]